MNPVNFLTLLPRECDPAFIGYVESCFGRAAILPLYSRVKLNQIFDNDKNKDLYNNFMNWLPTDDAPLVLEDDPEDPIIGEDNDVNKVQEWESFLAGKCSFFDKKYRAATWFYVYNIKNVMKSKMDFKDKAILMAKLLEGMNYQPFEKRTWALLYEWEEGEVRDKFLEECDRIVFYTEPELEK